MPDSDSDERLRRLQRRAFGSGTSDEARRDALRELADLNAVAAHTDPGLMGGGGGAGGGGGGGRAGRMGGAGGMGGGGRAGRAGDPDDAHDPDDPGDRDAPAGAASAGPSGRVADPATIDPTASGERRSFTRGAVAALVGAGIVVGAVAGAVVTSSISSSTADAGPTPTAVRGPDGILYADLPLNQPPGIAFGATAAVRVFDRPQVAADVPSGLSPEQVDLGTVRLLLTEADGTGVYGARTADGDDVCVIWATPYGSSASGCTNAGLFPAAGLFLGWQAPDGEAGEVRWLPDGTVSITPAG